MKASVQELQDDKQYNDTIIYRKHFHKNNYLYVFIAEFMLMNFSSILL